MRDTRLWVAGVCTVFCVLHCAYVQNLMPMEGDYKVYQGYCHRSEVDLAPIWVDQGFRRISSHWSMHTWTRWMCKAPIRCNARLNRMKRARTRRMKIRALWGNMWVSRSKVSWIDCRWVVGVVGQNQNRPWRGQLRLASCGWAEESNSTIGDQITASNCSKCWSPKNFRKFLLIIYWNSPSPHEECFGAFRSFQFSIKRFSLS